MPSEALSTPASHLLPPPLLDVPVRSGWDAFDDLRLPRAGRLILVDVAPEAQPLAERLLLGLVAGGVSARGRAMVLDASGAGVDGRRLVEAAAAVGVTPEAVLEGTLVARAPHPGDLLALCSTHLPARFEAHGPPGLLLVTGLPEACLDGALLSADGLAVLGACLERLRALADAHGLPVVLATGVLTRRPTKPLRRVLLEAAHESLALHPTPEGRLRVRVPQRGVELRVAPPEAGFAF